MPLEKRNGTLGTQRFDLQRNHSANQATSTTPLPGSNGQAAHHAFIVRGRLTSQPVSDRLVIRTGGRVVFLDIDEIDWIEAAANYIRVHSGKDCYPVRESIGGIWEQLAPGQFVRIHRSIIANICKIKELQPCNTGEYILVLKGGKELPCSRGYRAELKHLIQP
ncbi:MAG TPA: LytTR family DNA-binding domain-containing protein [Candidatus Angelobacter sp.]